MGQLVRRLMQDSRKGKMDGWLVAEGVGMEERG